MQQEIAAIVLEDQLDHPAFSWPESLIVQPLSADGDVLPVFAEEAGGARRPAQLFRKDGSLYAALVAGLESGGRRVFHLCPGEAEFAHAVRITGTGQSLRAGNGLLSLLFPRGGEEGEEACFALRHEASGAQAAAVLRGGARVLERELQVEAAGPVFADIALKLRLSGGERLRLTLRITAGLDFIELREQMEGFAGREGLSLALEWSGFAPEKRCASYRGVEPADAFLQEGGRIPMILTPFDSWVSWWTGRHISFADPERGLSAGLFVRRAEDWDDGKYGLWRSSPDFGVRFYWEEEQLRWEYPLRNGARCTAIALFDAAKDRDYSRSAAGDGLYGQSPQSPMALPYIQKEWFWQEWIPLQKVRGWTLRWEEEQSSYPRFFPRENFPAEGAEVWYLGPCFRPFEPQQLEKIVRDLSNSLNQMIQSGPVSNREFYDWAPIFDMAAPHMTGAQFDHLKAAFAFCAYAFSDECYMPVRRMLAGHPNFLADARGVAAVAAALFPHHPDARRWKNGYELAMARNLKYHTRPDVAAWGSRGGRWTENLGCYLFAMLRPANHAQTLLERSFGENVLLYPNIVKILTYVVQTLSAPVDGVREIPALGAHCRKPLKPFFDLHLWGDSLFRYEPLLAEQLWYLSSPDGPSFEANKPFASLYRMLAGARYPGAGGTRPELKSEKFTGFGFVLRSEAGTPEELNVDLIQIDEGPNYRWGRAADGGCGMICYYAGNRRYSGRGAEEAGDANMGAVQACTGFGVLMGHEYRSIGRSDLTEPLYDFRFAQFASLRAGDAVKPVYRSRSVLMSGSDYIIIYDEVGDCRVHGRFSWFNGVHDPFPNIVQLKPGASFVQSSGGIPADEPGAAENTGFTGRYYDGDGDFLTLVSHRPVNQDRGMYVTAAGFGCLVELQGRKDYIFRSSCKIRYRDGAAAFTGYAGIVRLYGQNRAEAALFSGSMISACGVSLQLAAGQKAGASFTLDHGRLYGFFQTYRETDVTLTLPDAAAGFRLYLNGSGAEWKACGNAVSFRVPAGKTQWEWSERQPVPMKPAILSAVCACGSVELSWSAAAGAEWYRIEQSLDCGESWTAAGETAAASFRLDGLQNGVKLHLRVRGVNRDHAGEPCWDYPVYISSRPPYPADGLRVREEEGGYAVSWGRQLGVSSYCLYRRPAGEAALARIYQGPEPAFFDPVPRGAYEYAASAVNGNGEGPLSAVRGTEEDGLARWDPQPGITFRRYLPSHEYGYRGFDAEESYTAGELPAYPD